MYTLFYKDVVFRAQAEYFYFSADFLAWKYSYIIRKLKLNDFSVLIPVNGRFFCFGDHSFAV